MAFTVHIARYESRNFTFEGVGSDEAQARIVLINTMREHARQAGIPEGWFSPDDICVTAYRTGKGYRDRQPMRG